MDISALLTIGIPAVNAVSTDELGIIDKRSTPERSSNRLAERKLDIPIPKISVCNVNR